MMKIAAAAVSAGLALGAIGLAGASDAHADGVLNSYERYAGDDSWRATCGVFDEMFTGRVMGDTPVAIGVMRALSSEYALQLDDGADVVNYQVYNYCPRHWDNLVAIGEAARSGIGATL